MGEPVLPIDARLTLVADEKKRCKRSDQIDP